MRRFSEELVEDREFEIGGQVFKWRYPYWVDYATLRDEDQKLIAQANKSQEGNEENPYTFNDLYSDWIKRVELFLDPENDSIDRWRKLAKQKENPVPAYQFSDVYTWLLEVASARPTEQPSPSENGQGQTVTTSKAASS